ncbi:MAG: MBL fold metallo-hydrolase [Proteobacteria bacterium]|nr:MBL fold metallo-hydrolase [Pseudomonadota bacterium]
MAFAQRFIFSPLHLLVPLASVLFLTACDSEVAVQSAPQAGSAELEAHSAEFERGVVQVTDGVYVAIGYALANTIMIEGTDGVIIVDTTESMAAARQVKAEFDKITDKPVKAIIYTHNHTDHIFGARVFAPNGDVPVYAHKSTWAHIERIMNVLRPVIGVRSYHMFGSYLESGGERVVNDGIGPALAHSIDGGTDIYGLIKPTHTFSDVMEVTIAGRHLQLIHSPGETDDQIVVWLPDERVLLPGDNVYKAFPNLYTIRGTRYRDVLKWARTLSEMRELGAEFLVPSHTRPVTGAEEIDDILGVYGDAIQYVHDQTVRGMNQGLDADELAETIQLPPHLASHPWLQPFYGTVPWSVRSVYDGYLGWFDGNSTTLFPTAKKQRALRLVALSGGAESVLAAAQESLEAGDPQWAAELADLLLQAEAGTSTPAKQLKAQALRKLASTTPNPNARNWYLTDALALEGKITIDVSGVNAQVTPEQAEFVKSFPIEGILNSMAVNLNPVASAGVDQSVVFEFPDQDKRFQIHVRNQVAVVHKLARGTERAVDGEIVVSVDASDWVDLVTGQKGFPLALANGTISVEGGLSDTGELLSFLQLFRAD